MQSGFAKVPTMQAKTFPSVRFDNDGTGKVVRGARLAAGKKLGEVAEAMGISAPYLCDLENGHRNWTAEKFEAAKKAIEGNGEGVAA